MYLSQQEIDTEIKHKKEMLRLLNRNRRMVEQQKVKHSGIKIPIELQNELDEVNKEIKDTERKIAELQGELESDNLKENGKTISSTDKDVARLTNQLKEDIDDLSEKIRQDVNNTKKKAKELGDTLIELRSIMNKKLIKDTKSKWDDFSADSDITPAGVAVGLILAVILMFCGWKLFQSQEQNVLEPVQSYNFESGLPNNFSTVGNVVNFGLEGPGLNGKQALRLDLSLAPYLSETGQGGLSLMLPSTSQVEAVSTLVFLPDKDESPFQPIYAQFVAESDAGTKMYSAPTQLRSGFWTPIFWGTRSTSWNNPKVKTLELWIFRYNEPYKGPVYVDDFVIYSLMPEELVEPTAVAASNN